MDDHVIDRLKHVLLKHKDRLRSWTRLMEVIADANNRQPERHIDRRTLERICSDDIEGVQLRISQLLALDHFFNLNNEGPLLTKSLSPISSIAESFNVNFLVAAKFHPALRDDAIARWDLRALTRLMRTQLNQLNVGVWDITGPDNWRDGDLRIINSANIAIGSPVVNYASEVLLCRMIGVVPKGNCTVDALPFYIVEAGRDHDVESSFVRAREDAMHVDANGIGALDPERRAVVIGGELFASTETRDYGLLVAQRKPDNGQVQMVLCGLRGQGTYQLARILQSGEPTLTLPPLLTGEEHPPILVALYEFTLVPDEDSRGRNTHRVVSYAPAAGPAFLHFLRDKWHFVRSNGVRSLS